MTFSKPLPIATMLASFWLLAISLGRHESHSRVYEGTALEVVQLSSSLLGKRSCKETSGCICCYATSDHPTSSLEEGNLPTWVRQRLMSLGIRCTEMKLPLPWKYTQWHGTESSAVNRIWSSVENQTWTHAWPWMSDLNILDSSFFICHGEN